MQASTFPRSASALLCMKWSTACISFSVDDSGTVGRCSQVEA